MRKRKPILLIDESHSSNKMRDLLIENNIEFVVYDIKKFKESCCGDIPNTKAPSIIASEGLFKGEDSIITFVQHLKNNKE